MFTVKRASNDSSAQLELYFTDIIINSVLTKVKLLQHDACDVVNVVVGSWQTVNL